MLMKVAIVLLAAFVVVAGLGLLFSARPTPILGADGDSLAHSISEVDSCTEIDGTWNCLRNGNIGYRVKVGWDGCWDATLFGKNPATRLPRTRSGCIDIWDHLRIENSFN